MFGWIGILESWVGVLAVNSIFAGVVFAVVLIVTRLAPSRGPAIRVALWSLVLIRLILPPGLGHPFSAGALIGKLVRSDARSISPVHPPGHEISAVSRALPGGQRHAEALMKPRQVAAVLWLAGFIAAATWQLRRRYAVVRALSQAPPVRDGDVPAAIESWRTRLGVRRRVRVVTSNKGLTPFTIGVVRPLIYLPGSVIRDPRCMEAAVAHEMAHVARFDALWLGLQNIVQTVYFFNPLVWITGALINDAREQLCDATVVAAKGLAARDYVGGLLDVLRLELQRVGAPTMAARKRRLGVRIRNIFEREGGPGPKIGAAVAVAAVMGLFLLPLQTSGVDASPASEAVAVGQTDPVLKTHGIPEFANPLPDGRVTWGWGPGHRDPFTDQEVSHKGVDLAAPAGTPVVSPANGVVVVATEAYETAPGYGTVILIDHGRGMKTFYAHLGSIAVAQGQRVEKGAVIAAVGSTGRSTGPHLHFEIRQDGEVVDPAEFVEAWN